MVAIKPSPMPPDELESRAVQLIGPRERRLFVMDDDGTYWVRPDMTAEEADQAVDCLAAWFYRALKGTKPGEPWFFRLYDDGKKVHR